MTYGRADPTCKKAFAFKKYTGKKANLYPFLFEQPIFVKSVVFQHKTCGGTMAKKVSRLGKFSHRLIDILHIGEISILETNNMYYM